MAHSKGNLMIIKSDRIRKVFVIDRKSLQWKAR